MICLVDSSSCLTVLIFEPKRRNLDSFLLDSPTAFFQAAALMLFDTLRSEEVNN